MSTIEIPAPPSNYELTDEVRRPSPSVDELCWAFGAGGHVGTWANSEWEGFERNPDLCGPIARRKLKQIDMSSMVGQYCEFGAEAEILMLTSVDEVGDGHYYAGSSAICTPIDGHTYAHTGGACPVPKGFDYEVMTSDGSSFTRDEIIDKSIVSIWNWVSPGRSRNIVHFKITGILEGYKL